MTFRIAKVTPKTITLDLAERGSWVVDRNPEEPHPRFMVAATTPDGNRHTLIGMHRTRDGSQMNPEYARFQGLLR